MPEGSSSAAPVINPGPRSEKNLRKRPWRTNARRAAFAPREFLLIGPRPMTPDSSSAEACGWDLNGAARWLARLGGWTRAAAWSSEKCRCGVNPALVVPAFAWAKPLSGRSGTRLHACNARVMRESQHIAAEHRDLAAHAHLAGAEHHGAEDHLTGHESSRQVHEHSNEAYLLTQKEHQKPKTEHGAEGTTHEAQHRDVAALAYKLWQDRNCPEGSSEEDWFRAVEQLRSA